MTIKFIGATFNLNQLTVESAVKDMDKRTGNVTEVTIRGKDGKTRVTGRDQQVMFVIGEVAAQGWGDLESVTSLPSRTFSVTNNQTLSISKHKPVEITIEHETLLTDDYMQKVLDAVFMQNVMGEADGYTRPEVVEGSTSRVVDFQGGNLITFLSKDEDGFVVTWTLIEA